MATRRRRSAKAELIDTIKDLGIDTLKRHGPGIVDGVIERGPDAVRAVSDATRRKMQDTRDTRERKRAAKDREKAAEKAAKKAAKPTPSAVPPKAVETLVGLQRHSPIQILSVNADAPGLDRYNLNGEWVTFRVMEECTLLGLQIQNGHSASYRFRDCSFKAGQELCLYSGSGKDSNKALYWGHSEPVWDNDADIVRVVDPDGVVLQTYRYEYSVDLGTD